MLVEPLISQASFNDAILLDLNLLRHLAEWALDLVGRELGVTLRLKAAEEHLVQHSNGLQGDGDDGGHLVRLEPEPHVAVTPDGHVWSATISHHVLFHGSGHCLKDLVVRVWA